MNIIRPLSNPVVVEGPLVYHSEYGCHNTLRLKAKLIKALPGIKTAKKVHYRAELWRSHEDLSARVKELGKKGHEIPLLIFLYTENETERNNA